MGPFHVISGTQHLAEGRSTIREQISINEQIRATEVRLIGADGSQVGVVPIQEALRLAKEEGLDLVEVAPSVEPPVCRILNFGKYKFQQNKRDQVARKKQKVSQLKEIQLRPKTEQHDFEFKVGHIRKFIGQGHKIKVTIKFRGREMSHTDQGRLMLEQIQEILGEEVRIEVPARLEGRNMSMIIAPKAKKG